jgi:uncharacterized damage-inducible protein DinB
MSDRTALLATYQNGATALLDALKDVPHDAMTWRPAPGEWSVAEVLWHCAECEAVFHTRVRTMWIGPERTVVAFDQEDWAAMPGYEGLPVETAVEVIRSTRAMTSALLDRLPDDAWDAEGRNTERGRVTLEDIVTHAAGHLDIHARQIWDNVRAWRAQAGQEDANSGAR